MSSHGSRRHFLASALAATGSVVLRPHCLLAAGKTRPELNFLVVSDTHLGYKDQATAADLWKKTAAELAGAPGDFVLHLGDIVDGGREAMYPEYLKHRALIEKPVHEIPGNHDPLPLFEKYIRKPVSTVIDHQWLRVLLVGNARTDSHDGFLTAEQLDWMDQRLGEARQQQRHVIVAMHVPAHSNRHPDRGWYVHPDEGQTALYALMEKYHDQVIALFHGHFHNGVRGWDDHNGLHEVLFPSALYNLDRRLEQQQAPGYNLAEFRRGYTRVSLSGSELKLTVCPLGEEPSLSKRLPFGQS